MTASKPSSKGAKDRNERLALVTLGSGVYAAARSVSLGAVGRKVDVVERAIRRGTGQDPELAEALARDESGDYSE